MGPPRFGVPCGPNSRGRAGPESLQVKVKDAKFTKPADELPGGVRPKQVTVWPAAQIQQRHNTPKGGGASVQKNGQR